MLVFGKLPISPHCFSSSRTPHKLPEMGNQVLSARKPPKQPDNTLKNIQKVRANNITVFYIEQIKT